MPSFMENYCAYHQNQLLTNFCTSPQCLLPVCPSCIKIHSEQHQSKNTTPSFQKYFVHNPRLNDIFSEVSISCSNVISNLQKLRQELLEVEKLKKQNQSLIRQKIKIYRNKLIRQFQRALYDLEYSLIKKFEDEDEKFIQQIQQLDKSIDKLYKNIQCQQKDLESDEGLRTVIFHLSKNIEIQSLEFISLIDKKVKDMLKKNIYLQIQQHKIDEIKSSVVNFLRLDSIQWGIQVKDIKQQTAFSFNKNSYENNPYQQKITMQKTKRTSNYDSYERINQKIKTFQTVHMSF